MTSIGKSDLYTLTQVKQPAIFHCLQHLDGLFRIHQGVQRLHRRQSGAFPFLVVPVGVTFLDVGGVPEHHGQQLSRQASCEDAAVEALFHQ